MKSNLIEMMNNLINLNKNFDGDIEIGIPCCRCHEKLFTEEKNINTLVIFFLLFTLMSLTTFFWYLASLTGISFARYPFQ